MPDESRDTHMEPVVECPYCKQDVFSRSLYGHVNFANDDEHGQTGTVPDDFADHDPKVVAYREFSVDRPSPVPPGERIMCKFCRRTFNGIHGLEVHLGMMDDEFHPDDIEARFAALRIGDPLEEEAPDDTDDQLAAYQQHLTALSDDSGRPGPEGDVSIDDLLQLLDEFRQREGEAGGFYKAAQMLEELIEENAKTSSRRGSSSRQTSR